MPKWADPLSLLRIFIRILLVRELLVHVDPRLLAIIFIVCADAEVDTIPLCRDIHACWSKLDFVDVHVRACSDTCWVSPQLDIFIVIAVF